MNTEGHHWVFSVHPEAAARAETERTSVSEGDHILLMTDGFFRLVEPQIGAFQGCLRRFQAGLRRGARGRQLFQALQLAHRILDLNLGQAHGDLLMDVFQAKEDLPLVHAVLASEQNACDFAGGFRIDRGGTPGLARADRADDDFVRGRAGRFNQDPRSAAGSTIDFLGLGARLKTGPGIPPGAQKHGQGRKKGELRS